MKSIFTSTLLFIFLTGFMACNSSQQEETAITNGLYRIVKDYNSPPENSNYLIVPYSHDFLDDNDGEPLYFEVDTSDYVPLDLAMEPEGIEQEDKRINLMLTLTSEAKQKLADFTEGRINERAAIVIDGKAVTQHKIRSKIDGGKLQITRCTDNACEHLLVKLKEVEKRKNKH